MSQHALSINGKRIGIEKDDLITFAKAMNIKKSEKIYLKKSKVQQWNNYANEVNVTTKTRDSIKVALLNREK